MSDAGGQEPIAPATLASGTSMGGASQHWRGKRLALIARIFTTVGAPLFAIGAWMPWVVVSGYAFVGGHEQDYALAVSPGDIAGPFDNFVWSALTTVGLLLLPLLWWRSQPLVSYVTVGLNTLWVMLVGVLAPPAHSFSHDISRVPDLNPQSLIITHHGQGLLGFWVANAGVALIAIGAFLSLIVLFLRPSQHWSLLRAGVRSTTATSRLRVALPGASALTIGLALWAVSTFVMPWASVNCSTTPLFIGTCTGLPYNTVLQFGIADVTTLIDPLAAHYAVGVLLGGGAAMILVGLWLRARSVAFCGWATLWLVLAAAFAWLAEDGVGVVVAKHDALGLPAGAWVGENAVLLTLLGFALALGGLAYLWVDAVRHRKAASFLHSSQP